MPNPQRYNYRNRGVSEANTKLVLASLKSGQKSITELQIVTGLTRQTIVKKLSQLSELVDHSETHPKKYYLKSIGYQTVVDEIKDKNKEPNKFDAVKAAIAHGNDGVMFFPQATYNDLSIFHDKVNAGEVGGKIAEAYAAIESAKDIEMFEITVKTFHDLIQFRKKLKEFE